MPCQGTERTHACFDAQRQALFCCTTNRRHPSCCARESPSTAFRKRVAPTLRNSSGRTRAGRHCRGMSRPDQDPDKDATITVPDERRYKPVVSEAGISAKDRSEVPSKHLNWMRRNATSTGERYAQPSTCHLTGGIYNLLSRRQREECQILGSVTCSL